MEWQWAFAPLYAAGLCGVLGVVLVFGRGPSRTFLPRWPMAWGGLLLMLGSLVALHYQRGPFTWVALGAVGRLLGMALLMAAAGLAVSGSRVRLRAEALRSSAPRSIDEGVAALRAGAPPGWGVYRGRLTSSEQVTSPSGVVCAFYEAELRGLREDGGKGPLLSTEQGASSLVQVRGERAEAVVSLSPRLVLAPVQVRRCQRGLSLADAHPGEPVGGGGVEESLSHERVGRQGEECLVVGELTKGPVEGVYTLRGKQGGPAMVILGGSSEDSGQSLSRQTWKRFAGAAALTVAAAWLLAQ